MQHELQALSRRELQARAKSAGVAANLSSRAIIEVLLARGLQQHAHGDGEDVVKVRDNAISDVQPALQVKSPMATRPSQPSAAYGERSPAPARSVAPNPGCPSGLSPPKGAGDLWPQPHASSRDQDQAASPGRADNPLGLGSPLSLPRDLQPLCLLSRGSKDQGAGGLASPLLRRPGSLLHLQGEGGAASPQPGSDVKVRTLGGPSPMRTSASPPASPMHSTLTFTLLPLSPPAGSALTLASVNTLSAQQQQGLRAPAPTTGAAAAPALALSYFDVSAVHSPLPARGPAPVSSRAKASLQPLPQQQLQRSPSPSPAWRPGGKGAGGAATAAAAARPLSKSVHIVSPTTIAAAAASQARSPRVPSPRRADMAAGAAAAARVPAASKGTVRPKLLALGAFPQQQQGQQKLPAGAARIPSPFQSAELPTGALGALGGSRLAQLAHQRRSPGAAGATAGAAATAARSPSLMPRAASALPSRRTDHQGSGSRGASLASTSPVLLPPARTPTLSARAAAVASPAAQQRGTPKVHPGQTGAMSPALMARAALARTPPPPLMTSPLARRVEDAAPRNHAAGTAFAASRPAATIAARPAGDRFGAGGDAGNGSSGVVRGGPAAAANVCLPAIAGARAAAAATAAMIAEPSCRMAAASASVPATMKSPLQTPARRVTAALQQSAGPAGGGVAEPGASWFDELIRRDMLAAGPQAGMKSVIGMTSIKQQLLSLVLPVLQAAQTVQPSSARPQAARSATVAASGPPGEVPWFKPVLLFGPSGVGKTALARAVAAEVTAAAAATAVAPAVSAGRAMGHRSAAGSSGGGGGAGGGGCRTYYVDIAQLLGRLGGQADKAVQAVFRAVHARSGPVTVIVDNLEAIQSSQRGSSLDDAEAACRVRTALLVGCDEVLYCSGGNGGSTATGAGLYAGTGATQQAQRRGTAAATSSMKGSTGASAAGAAGLAAPLPVVLVGVAGGGAHSVDDGLARCFTAARMYVPLPDADTREALVFLEMAKHEADLNVDDIAQLAKRTEGYSGAEILALCTAALLAAASKQLSAAAGQRRGAVLGAIDRNGPAAPRVNMSHFEAAFPGVQCSLGLSHAAAVDFFKWKAHLARLL